MRRKRESEPDGDAFVLVTGHQAPSSRKRRKCRFPSFCLNGYWLVMPSASTFLDPRNTLRSFVTLIVCVRSQTRTGIELSPRISSSAYRTHTAICQTTKHRHKQTKFDDGGR